MKTLLLALVVVAFVCLGSADQLGLGRQQIDQGWRQAKVSSSRRCYECTKENHWYKCLSAKICPMGQNMCYTWHKPDENGEMSWAVKGCTKRCPTAGPDEHVRCCFTQECNSH